MRTALIVAGSLFVLAGAFALFALVVTQRADSEAPPNGVGFADPRWASWSAAKEEEQEDPNVRTVLNYLDESLAIVFSSSEASNGAK